MKGASGSKYYCRWQREAWPGQEGEGGGFLTSVCAWLRHADSVAEAGSSKDRDF